MSPKSWQEVERLFHLASELDPSERAAFLRDACGDVQIRQEVESLLRRQEDGDALLEAKPQRPLLDPGARLGPYEVLSLIGAGGMGEVYQARDERLGRRVAIKVSATQFSRWFESEARAIAALNHPNICTLYDVGPNYLVMELVEGETLASRLQQGTMAAVEVTRLGIEIADALAAAHDRGIIHRDVKPGNIMLAAGGGGIKVLDFGVAKFEQPSEPGRPSQRLSANHRILGTLAYMAPEQLSGGMCDARSDIYSLGVVLREMLWGARTLESPETNRTPLEEVIRKCLAHDSAERWQSARDLKAALESAGRTGPTRMLSRSARSKPIGAAAALTAAAAITWMAWPESQPLHAHFVMGTPEGTRMAMRMPTKSLVSVSPDGQTLVVVVEDIGGERSLWLRRLDATSFQRLEQTEGASYAFWSPDSRHVAFIADGKLKRVPVAGGPAQTICETEPGDGEGGTWSRDGVIVFARPRPSPAAMPSGELYRVPASGGVAERFSALDKEQGEIFHAWPQFLPGGRQLLYFARTKDAANSRVVVQDIASGERRVLLRGPTQAFYGTGAKGRHYLLYPRDRALYAQPLNLNRLELQGEAAPVASEVSYNTHYGTAAFSVSDTGVLAYRRGIITSGTSPLRRLAWYNRQGQRLAIASEPGLYKSVSLSPDESRIAVDRADPKNPRDWGVWILEPPPGPAMRLMSTPGFDFPVWSPDSRRIAAVARIGEGREIVEIPIASRLASTLTSGAKANIVEGWTPDGQQILFTSGAQAFALSTGDRTTRPILEPEGAKGRLQVSPDGRWIAYQSDESGRNEVYLRPYPVPGVRRTVSRGGGSQPVWRADGRELFYLTLNSNLMSVDIPVGRPLEVSSPHLVFPSTVEGSPVNGQYAVSRDGQRFLVMEPVRSGNDSGIEQFHVELRWFAELAGRAPGK